MSFVDISFFNVFFQRGATPIMMACIFPGLDVIEYFIQKNAVINLQTKDSGDSALSMALIGTGTVEEKIIIVNLLVNNSINTTLENKVRHFFIIITLYVFNNILYYIDRQDNPQLCWHLRKEF